MIHTEWLKKQGIMASASELQQLIELIQTELEMRVGYILQDQLGEEKTNEFERVHDSGDEDAAIAFLDKECPDYPRIVRRELRTLREEIRAATDKKATIESWAAKRQNRHQ